MLLHIPEVLSAEQLRQLRTAIDGGPWEDGRASVGEQGARVKNNEQLAAGSELARTAAASVLEALSRSLAFFSAALPLRISTPSFNRYRGGGSYGMHVDGAIRAHGPIDGVQQHLRTDLSCTLFLTEPEAYDGGELVVSDTYGTHEVKLPAGDLILYPSTSLHRVEPVTRAERVSCFFWVQSMVRADAQRTMLYELDRSIQQLRARAGDDEITVALTGHYHNLLRLWAEL